MEQERLDKIENLVSMYNQLCLYMTLMVIYIIVRTLRKKKQPAPSIITDTNFVYNTDCPICFNGFTIPVKSDCGHGFCIDCLYTYWKKPTWNNMCPLCRKTLSNLKPVEDSIYDAWTDEATQKIKRITSRKNFCRLTLANRSTIYSCFFCAIFLILWTYAVSNLNKMVYFIFSLYNSLYDVKTTINV